MDVRLLLIALVLSCATAHTQEITVMTFNIRYGTAEDGPNSWPHRADLVAETIRLQAPDILGLQECLRFQAEELDAMLPDYHWFGTGRDADGQGEMCAIFYRHGTMRPMTWETFWLSESPGTPGSVSWDSSLTRIASTMRFLHTASKKTVHVVNTHFDHRGENARRESAALIVRHVENLPKQEPLVVMGDFNAVAEHSAPWDIFMASGLRDARMEAEAPLGPVTTWCDFEAPAPEATSRIDWILLRGPATVQRYEAVNHNREGRYPSDHLPVSVRLDIAAAPEAN